MFLFKLLSHLPLVVLHLLGGLVGCLVWLFSPSYRRHLGENARLAFPGTAAGRIIFGSILQTGYMVFELPRLWLGSQDQALSQIRKVEGWDNVEKARAAGKGLIFLTPHLGCFELAGQYCASKLPITILFRPPRQAWLAPLMRQGRGKNNVELAPADVSGVRLMIRALKRHGAVGLLPDQAPSAGDGRWLNFFGRPAYTMTLAARLSEMNTAVILIFVRRLSWGRGFELIFREPLEPLTGDTVHRAQQINHEIEALIRLCPEQYLWGYNRYKRPRGAEAPPDVVRVEI